jgi:hypothetical protein
VQSASALGFGKANPGTSYQALYLIGTVKNVTGVFRSTDKGATWLRVNDDAHQWGAIGGLGVITGDPGHAGARHVERVAAASVDQHIRRVRSHGGRLRRPAAHNPVSSATSRAVGRGEQRRTTPVSPPQNPEYHMHALHSLHHIVEALRM